MGRDPQAIASFDKALELKPDYASAYYNKASCYALQSQVDLAQNLQQASSWIQGIGKRQRLT